MIKCDKCKFREAYWFWRIKTADSSVTYYVALRGATEDEKALSDIMQT
jgi:hypothetical protein